MKIILTETQYKTLIESKGDLKSFLKNQLGLDFTDNIKQITSTYDVPMSFDECVGWDTIRRWMNFWGPLYLFEYDDVKYLYQGRSGHEFFIADDNCYEYVDNEIPEKLGIAEMGFSFSDILNMYFEEEEL
jgi:hypothetical protein